LGAAIGDALGFARCGLRRRQAIKLFGRVETKFRFARDVAITGFNTSQILMTAQSVVSSGTDVDKFDKSFRRRLGGYSFTLPTDMKSTSRWMSRKSLLHLKKPAQASQSLSNDCVIRPLLLVLALHNTNLGTRSWTEHAVANTHKHPLAIQGCHLLAGLTNLIINERGTLNAPAAANFLSQMECSSEYVNKLKLLVKSLENERSAVAVARQLGWRGFVPGEIVPTVVMSIYCFLRHHQDYRRAVLSAIGLGGDTSTLGAVVGALSGARLGVRRIPSELIKQIPPGHYGTSWIEDLSHRLAYWPHGADDLHDAPPLPASPFTIIQGNLAKWLRLGVHCVTRKPRTMLVRS
jgi:ADP-ribosylglycohydrolase